MIKILILIQASLTSLLLVGCSDEGAAPAGDLNPSTSVSGEAADDPLKRLEDEGKLPKTGTGGKMPVMGAPSGVGGTGGTVAESLSLYPPSVDPDQDNFPSAPISGHPEVAIDNCPSIFNPGQEDANANGIGDICE